MGFDLYGLNPKGDVPKPVITDWEDEKQTDDFLKYQEERYQKENNNDNV